MKGNSGPIKTILIGDKTVDIADFHAAWESDPINDSGAWSKSWVVPKRKAKAKTRKIKTNLIREIFIIVKIKSNTKYFVFQSTINETRNPIGLLIKISCGK
jgi:hypothetical protein